MGGKDAIQLIFKLFISLKKSDKSLLSALGRKFQIGPSFTYGGERNERPIKKRIR